MSSMVDEITACEEAGYEVSTIVLTTDQWLDMLKKHNWVIKVRPPKPEETTLFGAGVELKDDPLWTVLIEEEYNDRHFNMHCNLQLSVL